MAGKVCTVKGFTGNLKEIAGRFNIPYETLHSRLRRGIPLEEAISLPVSSKSRDKIYTVNGFTGTLLEVSRKFGIGYNTLYARLNKGMTLEEALFEQVNSKNNIYNVYGFSGTLDEIASKFCMEYFTLIRRLKDGMSLEEAVSTPVRVGQYRKSKVYTVYGYRGTIKQIASKFNINERTLRGRLRRGMSLEEALDPYI